MQHIYVRLGQSLDVTNLIFHINSITSIFLFVSCLLFSTVLLKTWSLILAHKNWYLFKWFPQQKSKITYSNSRRERGIQNSIQFNDWLKYCTFYLFFFLFFNSIINWFRVLCVISLTIMQHSDVAAKKKSISHSQSTCKNYNWSS